MKCADVLSSLAPMLKCVDVRIAAYQIEGGWYVASGSIRFSDAAVEDRKQDIENEWASLPSADVQGFRHVFDVVEISRWEELRSQLQSGRLKIRAEELLLPAPLQISECNLYLNWNAPSETGFPTFSANISPNRTGPDTTVHGQLRNPEGNESLARMLGARGYSSVADAIRPYLGLEKDSRDLFGPMFSISVPVYALIGSRWLTGDTLTASVKLHESGWQQFKLHGRLQFEGSDRRFLVSVRPKSNGKEAVGYVGSVDLPCTDPEAKLELTLSHKEVGIVYTTRDTLKALMPVERISPLWAVFQRFCSADELTALLAKAAFVEDDPRLAKPQAQFENHVSWMLSCFGFISIPLGKREKLLVPGKKIELGTIDIIAFHPNHNILLFGACSLTPPDRSQLGCIVSVRNYLLEELAAPDLFSTSMVIFTSAPYTESAFVAGEPGFGMDTEIVHVFDARRMREAMDALLRRDFEWLNNQIAAHGIYPDAFA